MGYYQKGEKIDVLVGIDHLSDGSLRMLQSHSNMDKLSDVAKSKLSSPTKGLDEYEQALSHTVVDFTKGKIMNVGALEKKESFAEKATDFLEGLSLENWIWMWRKT